MMILPGALGTTSPHCTHVGVGGETFAYSSVTSFIADQLLSFIYKILYLHVLVLKVCLVLAKDDDLLIFIFLIVYIVKLNE